MTTNLIIQYVVVALLIVAAVARIIWSARNKKKRRSGGCCGCALYDSCGDPRRSSPKDGRTTPNKSGCPDCHK